VVKVFTGLIQDLGAVDSVEATDAGARLTVSTKLATELGDGDSVSVNGVCLTATRVDGGRFVAEVMNQTLTLTALGGVGPGDRVNLELPLRASDRLGGHVVQGHVDGVAEATEVREDGFSRRLRVATEAPLLRYVVERGSIALDGVSLTVAALGQDWIEVALIPETLGRTNLGALEPGDKVNVECDVLAKHLERLMAPLGRKEGT
jgi:riboflavin synthase